MATSTFRNKRNAPVSSQSVLALRDRTRSGSRALQIFSGLKYNIPLFTRKFTSTFVNFAGGLFKLEAYEESLGQKLHYSKVLRRFSNLALLAGVVVFSAGAGIRVYNSNSNPQSTVSAAEVPSIEPEPLGAFEQWMLDNTGFITNTSDDTDEDGLTNYEEFLLGSNVSNKYSCGNAKTDAQLALELINPGTCKKVDLTSAS